MKDVQVTMDLLKKNGIDFRKTVLYNEDNERCGTTLWLNVGHIEFDLFGKIKNIVNY